MLIWDDDKKKSLKVSTTFNNVISGEQFLQVKSQLTSEKSKDIAVWELPAGRTHYLKVAPQESFQLKHKPTNLMHMICREFFFLYMNSMAPKETGRRDDAGGGGDLHTHKLQTTIIVLCLTRNICLLRHGAASAHTFENFTLWTLDPKSVCR